jgi:hypothetical protein
MKVVKATVIGLAYVLLVAGCTQTKSVLNKSAIKAPAPKMLAEDERIFTDVQRQTFNYFWEGAEPVSGMARERFHVDGSYPEDDKDVVTTGGTGFGVMAMLVGMHRGFITRAQGRERMDRIVNFLKTADRFHGVWPHWLYGETGKVKPFSRYDDGGDLVETSFLLQGLLCVKQYFKDGDSTEKALSCRIDTLYREVDFNWYRNNENVLYWHWSPNHQWKMNFPVKGYNECLIMYVLAAGSPTSNIKPEVYHSGWAGEGRIVSPWTVFNQNLQLYHQGDSPYGGPLFWAHYSFLGLDPRGLQDQYADYWQENKSQALINYAWCVKNPKYFRGYGPDNWGLTASYSVQGYAAHGPGNGNDLGVISPTAALSSFPYTPVQSMQALRHWYNDMNDKLWGPYGFYDAFSQTSNWFPKRYLAIDQGPIVVMMENYRSGLLWNLFMSSQDVQSGLKKLGFVSPHIKNVKPFKG